MEGDEAISRMEYETASSHKSEILQDNSGTRSDFFLYLIPSLPMFCEESLQFSPERLPLFPISN